jgi:hypothetical protein
VLEELRTLYTPQEELNEAVRWAVEPKESVVKESLKLTIREHSCVSIHEDPAQKIRTVYRGLLALRPEYLLDFAKVIAAVALGKNEICREVGKYFCFGDSVPQTVVEALALGRRITLETYTVIPTPRCVEDDYELMKQLALTDARKASAVCLE